MQNSERSPTLALMLAPSYYFDRPTEFMFNRSIEDWLILMKYERAQQVYFKCYRKHPKIAERIKKKYRIQTETDMSVALGFCLLATQNK